MQKRIKRCLVLLMLLVGGLLVSACNKEEKIEEEKEPDFVYPAAQVAAFCLDTDGILYTYEPNAKSIRVYDKEGNKINEVTTESKKYISLAAKEGVVYAFSYVYNESTRKNDYSLEAITLADGSRKVLYENPLACSVEGMYMVGDSLYFLEKEAYDMAEAAMLDDLEGGYSYYGEGLKRLKLVTGEVNNISIERLKLFCRKDDLNLWIYAYDVEVGEFYFAEYNLKTEKIGERYYTGDATDGFLLMIAYDSIYEKLLYPDIFKQAILALEPAAPNEQTSFFQTAALPQNGNDLQYQAGYTYLLSEGKVQRIVNKSYIKDNVALKIYSTSYYELPEGTGYNLDLEHVDEETMAMALMAGDSNYDMLVLSSEEPLAEQIRRIGAYEPLNEVEGVTECLDAGFDYIKDAATAENGAVWMLPYEVDCEVLLYNPSVCERYGIDMEKVNSHERLLEVERTLREAEQTNPAYYDLRWNFSTLMEQYLADYAVVDNNAEFDTELFRYYSEIIKEKYHQGGFSNSRYSWIAPGNVISTYEKSEEQVATEFMNYFSNVAVARLEKREISYQYGHVGMARYGFLSYDFFEVKAIPSLEPEKPQESIASTTFIVLNPRSEHLEEAEEYLSVIAKRLTEEESIYRTKELTETYSALEQKVHELYGDARIVFSYPEDVFWTEYLKYMQGEKTLDEVIQELERKLNTYSRE